MKSGKTNRKENEENHKAYFKKKPISNDEIKK